MAGNIPKALQDSLGHLLFQSAAIHPGGSPGNQEYFRINSFFCLSC